MDQTKVYDTLLIEDDEIERLLVRTLINSRAPQRFQLVEAPDLLRGLEILRQRKFDLVLLDHTLPQLTSIQELRLVLAEQRNVPVILHTGYIAPAAESEALRLGVRQVVEKGELDPLWEAIERTLDHVGDRQDAAQRTADSGKTILVVEDEPAVRRILRMSLELADYTVHEAENGEAALELMHRVGQDIDLVVADLMMPGTGGTKLSAALNRLRSGLPVLFVSGADVSDLQRALGRLPSPDEVLWKPFTPDQLAARVAKLLNRN